MTTTQITFNVLAQDAEGFREKRTVQAANITEAQVKANELADADFLRILSVRPR